MSQCEPQKKIIDDKQQGPVGTDGDSIRGVIFYEA